MIKKLILASMSLLLAAPALAQKQFSSVEEQMTGKEFLDTGLVKLTPDELAALNAWLRAHSVATLDSPRPGAAVAGGAATGVDSRGFEDTAIQEMDGSDIHTRIVGNFSGWDGNTVFTLENGMIWKQVESSTFGMAAVDNPPVTLEKGAFGAWRLSVDGYNKKVRVERIQ